MLTELSTEARLMTREETIAFLNANGFPTKASHFNKICMPSRNQGPPVATWFGKRPLYRKSDVLAWAQSKCRPARGGTINPADSNGVYLGLMRR